MANLMIWIDNTTVIDDEGEYDDLENILDEYIRINEFYTDGGENYDFIIAPSDEYLMIRDDLTDKNDNLVGRYELRR